jgi:Arc/MetJ-type ribon-helix-helix transcriptional regulator
MTIDSPLSPHHQQFIREQLATGRFQSEREVSDWLKQELDKGLSSRPGEPLCKEFWEQLRNRVRAATASGNDA